MKLTIFGERTSCLSGEMEIVPVIIEKYYNESMKSWWIQIIEGSVTGYESFEFSHIDNCCEKGWMACMGTKGVWDKLFIPAEEIKKIKEYFLCSY